MVEPVVPPRVDEITVLSIPAGHTYTQAIRPDGVTYLPDADVNGNWWPHPAFRPQWWDEAPEAARVDVVHVHFGFEHLSPDETRQFTDVLARRGIPLVVTVHDLDNPHLEDQAAHHERVRVLVDAAAAVITLTDAARAQLPGRTIVVPHPRIVPADRPEPRHQRRVGIFLKSMRGNVVAEPAFYARIVEGADAPVTIHLHDTVAGFADRLPDVHLHPPMTDDELFTAVGECSVVLLPYLRGTHSGWLEMCRDLGVCVAVPDSGCYASQADRPDAVATYRAGDADDAMRAVNALLAVAPLPREGDRDAELDSVRAAHASIYAGVVIR